MKTLDTLPSDSIDPIDTCFPLESNEFDRDTGKPISIRDRLYFTLVDFEVPNDVHPDLGPLETHDEITDAAYLVCELIMEHTKREDLRDASVFFDEFEPALHFYSTV
jgi:hypothetical protein